MSPLYIIYFDISFKNTENILNNLWKADSWGEKRGWYKIRVYLWSIYNFSLMWHYQIYNCINLVCLVLCGVVWFCVLLSFWSLNCSTFSNHIIAMDCTLCILTDESWTKGGLKMFGKHDVPCYFIENSSQSKFYIYT